MIQAKNNLRRRVCLVIKFLYHGYRQSIHFPMMIDQKTQQASNIKVLCCQQQHSHISLVYFEQYTFRRVLERVLKVLKQKHNGNGVYLLRIPSQLQAVRIYNATHYTDPKQIELQDYLSSIVEYSGVTNNSDQNHIKNKSIELYLRWHVQTIQILYMDYFWTNIIIEDMQSKIELISREFKNVITQKLKYKSDSLFHLVYAPDNSIVDQTMNFYQYRKQFHKSSCAEWLLVLKSKQNSDSNQLRLKLQKLGVDVERLVCPISQQIMFNPRYIKQCRHCFEQEYIMLALFMHKRCPLCKIQVSPTDTLPDQLGKYSIKCMVQECRVQRNMVELRMMANMYDKANK